MYESPLIKSMRAAVADAADDAEFRDRLLEAIKTDPEVRAAIIRLVRTPQPPPAGKKATPARSKGRGR